MLKSEKRFKYFKSREHILTILRETYPELKLEDIYLQILQILTICKNMAALLSGVVN